MALGVVLVVYAQKLCPEPQNPRDEKASRSGGDVEYQEESGSCLDHTWLAPGLWVDQIREPRGEISGGGAVTRNQHQVR